MFIRFCELIKIYRAFASFQTQPQATEAPEDNQEENINFNFIEGVHFNFNIIEW